MIITLQTLLIGMVAEPELGKGSELVNLLRNNAVRIDCATDHWPAPTLTPLEVIRAYELIQKPEFTSGSEPCCMCPKNIKPVPTIYDIPLCQYHAYSSLVQRS